MTLEFADFAHRYRNSGMTDAQQRDDFGVFSDMLECVARFFWRDGPPNSLGISFDSDSTNPSDAVESKGALRVLFNELVGDDAAESETP